MVCCEAVRSANLATAWLLVCCVYDFCKMRWWIWMKLDKLVVGALRHQNSHFGNRFWFSRNRKNYVITFSNSQSINQSIIFICHRAAKQNTRNSVV